MAIKLIISRRGAADDVRTFAQEIVTLGGDPSATVFLADAGAAPEQAIILDEGGHLLLINRADGTLLNGEPLAREARRTLARGDTLRIGPYDIRLAAPDASADRTADDAAAALVAARHNPEPARESAAAHPAPADEQPRAAAEGPRREAEGPRSFASILDSLRTEEDSFYFQIESGDGARTRVAIGDSEMMIGWDETGRRISCEAAHVVAPRAVARKDWSGVVVLALSPGTVSVNGEPVEAPRRLRNGDRLTLLPTASGGTDVARAHVVFHEPTSLVVLDSLLPQQLPPPVGPAHNAPAGAAALLPNANAAAASAADAARGRAAASDRRYFGYFTLAEVLVMIAGTVVAAVVIFLILEYS